MKRGKRSRTTPVTSAAHLHHGGRAVHAVEEERPDLLEVVPEGGREADDHAPRVAHLVHRARVEVGERAAGEPDDVLDEDSEEAAQRLVAAAVVVEAG
jgi:hypothetical protein